LERVEEIRDLLGFNESNSQLDTSESSDSYHLHFIPEYRNKPPTLQLLQSALKTAGLEHNFEVYPQRNRPFRLPFGPKQKAVSWPHAALPQDWSTRLYWFHKLDPYPLEGLPRVNLTLPLEVPQRQARELSYAARGREYWEQGLVEPHSRHKAQLCVIIWSYRQNIPLDETIRLCWQWIQHKHHGFSPTILRSPRAVYGEIVRQAQSWYGKAASLEAFPDSVHLGHWGYLCKADLVDIIQICRGSLPKMRFLGGLVRYLNPRRYRDRIGVHRDKLIDWSSVNMYLKRLDELKGAGLLTRPGSYSVGSYSKAIRLNWFWRPTGEAILEDNRSVGFERAIPLVISPEQFREELLKAGTSHRTSYKVLTAVFDC
jgi:hypothetical protein